MTTLSRPTHQTSTTPAMHPPPGGLGEPEWLLTDGYGGFALGTLSGVPSRRYHALLVASRKPPLDRATLLHSLADRLVWPDGRVVWLAGYRFADGGLGPMAAHPTCRVCPDEVSWTFDLPGSGFVTRSLRLTPGTATITWEASGLEGVELQARPMTPLLDFHALGRSHAELLVHERSGETRVARGGTSVALHHAGWTFQHRPETWWHVALAHEADRGYDSITDLPSPGVFKTRLADEPVTLAARHPDYADVSSDERMGADGLARAVGAYVVRRGTSPRRSPGWTILAGYPWFGDWGRDTMIALPGAMLETGRFDDALSVLRTFADARQNGVIPNRFSDSGSGAEFNTADASLWFLHAATEWARMAQDAAGFREHLLPACQDIIRAYRLGIPVEDTTIRIDPADGLVRAGNHHSQLTWMDARRDGHAFTPRPGKPVELSALWVHGLRRIAALTSDDELASVADTTAERFQERFFDDRHGWCADRLDEHDAPVFELRPNQLFAASLSHGPLTRDQGLRVARACIDHLWTPRGVRTLWSAGMAYHPRFAGTMAERDAAYHQGTAWPWLLGPLVEAWVRNGGDLATAERLIEPILAEMTGPCPGQIAEVYDAEGWGGTPERWSDDPDEPQRPGGCPAQAWSVAEVYRASRIIELGCESAW